MPVPASDLPPSFPGSPRIPAMSELFVPAPAAIVRRLRRSEIFVQFRQAFEAATGQGLILRIPGSFDLPLHGSRHLNRFCALLTTRSSACAACLRCQHEVEARAAQEPATLECHAGLAESLVPVRCRGRVVAFLQTGQVWLKAGAPVPPPQLLQSFRLARCTRATRLLEEAYRGSPVVTQDRYDSLLRLLRIFAEQLGTLIEQFLDRRLDDDSPVARRVRTYLSEHYEERISLAVLARAMNMSSFHLCKSFRRLTGTNFAQYLANVRIEAVKQHLTNPRVRITEVAFAAGFQSLSQFNRLFRRMTGMSPRDYRQRLRKIGAIRTS